MTHRTLVGYVQSLQIARDFGDFIKEIKKENKFVGILPRQETMRELHSFVYKQLTSSDSKDPVRYISLCRRLMQLMSEAHGREFNSQIEVYRARTEKVFEVLQQHEGASLPLAVMTNHSDELAGRAKIFDEQRMFKQGNYLRCIYRLCLVVNEHHMHNHTTDVGRACVYAFNAGADPDKIKQALLLLF